MRSLTQNDYTVGWVCALPIELAAAKTMLDEIDHPVAQNQVDSNNYTLGRIGSHNVVIACLPAGQLGNNSAAIVAAQMACSFTSIRFGLLVGIGGGVPLKDDVRLGDVVVSKPGSMGGGVVQYDFGKTVQGGNFIHTGTLNAPPAVLLSALSTLQSNHILGENGMAYYLSQIPINSQQTFRYLGADQDRLFKPDSRHVDNNPTCEHCDEKSLINRPIRASANSVVHYGMIASANQLMTDSLMRDRLGKQFKILCFEMEAAGLMNNFPCVVIRGICDYADSHKNKIWQPYAAATAAAYAKELLSVIPPHQVAKTATVSSPSHSTPAISAVSANAFSISDLPSIILVDDRPDRNHIQEIIEYARSLSIKMYSFLSTAAAREWMESNLGDPSQLSFNGSRLLTEQ
jgi:nucleoside phosphorylase